LDEPAADEVRLHLAQGCRECLGDVFSRPVGAPREASADPGTEPVAAAPPATKLHLPSVPALVMAGITLAVIALATLSVISSEPGEATPTKAPALADRIAELESMQAALANRFDSLAPALDGAEEKLARQVAAARDQAAESAHMREQLTAAEARLGRLSDLIRRRQADLRREVASVRTRVDGAPGFLGTGMFAPGVAQRPSGCAALSGEAASLCRSFCASRDCTNHPSVACDHLQTRFQALTGATTPPCNSNGTTVTQQLTPCDRDHVDLWTFSAQRDQQYQVSVDTVDAATAADFCVVGVCDGGDTFFGDDQVVCSSGPAGLGCPQATFVASGDEACTAAVTICSSRCADAATARYQLTVGPTDALTLAGDDVVDPDLASSRTAQK